MLSLIVGVKGTGKTKKLIEMTNKAVDESHGCVVCLEKGGKLIHDIKHEARLIDTDDYYVADGQSLYGFVAGILASNYDITHIFIDSALKICKNDVPGFENFLTECEKLTVKYAPLHIVITSSVPAEEVTEIMYKYI